MAEPTYDGAPIKVRDDLVSRHRLVWRLVARAGTWLTGEQRVAIAAETRHASGCALCARRKDALSPFAVTGTHDHLDQLPDVTVDMIHRIVTDPARLSRDWFQSCLDAGLSEEEYVETLAVIGSVVAIDTFAKAIGMAPHPLPVPEAGTPARERPARAKPGPAWVSWIDKADATGDDLQTFGPDSSNVRRALSLVPAEAHSFMGLIGEHYLPESQKSNFDSDARAISRQQIELVAGRVSAINQCVY